MAHVKHTDNIIYVIMSEAESLQALISIATQLKNSSKAEFTLSLPNHGVTSEETFAGKIQTTFGARCGLERIK